MSRRSDVDRSAGKPTVETHEPVVMADVMRELQAMAAIVEASQRARSLLTRLRTQFIGDLIGEGRPADRPSRADRPARAA